MVILIRSFSTWYLQLSEQNIFFSNKKLQNHLFLLLINTTNKSDFRKLTYDALGQ